MALDDREATLKKQWRLGPSIVLSWAFDPNGLLTIVVPHYFLGNFTLPDHPSGEGQNNEDFIRQLISGSRFKVHYEIFENAGRLGVAPSFIKLDSPLNIGEASIEMIDEMIKRHSVGHKESRAVALFDIAYFSLFRPFQQASQNNSLSYSMNSTYSKLKREGAEVNFARETTGDVYYLCNRDLGAFPNVDLLAFFLLVLIDNAVAPEKSQVGTVPTLRLAFHIGSHYELPQAEGINPTVFSYIVGDVTIKLARLIKALPPAGIHVGDFTARLPDVDTPVDQAEFLRYPLDELLDMSELRIDEKQLSDIRFESWSAGQSEERLIEVTDKHDMSQGAHIVGFAIELEGLPLSLGMSDR